MQTDTKTALLNSAEQAARRRGFDGFSYADLAAEVGIRKASIHYHFPTKAALSLALIERYHDALHAACISIATQHETGAARLAALVDYYRAATQDGKSLCLCVAFSISRESLPVEAIEEVRRARAMMTEWIADCFALGQADGSVKHVTDPAIEAAAMLPLLEGAQLAARAEENPALYDSAVRMFDQRF